MNKEDIQKTRQIIKQGDLEALKEAFNENPELMNAETAFGTWLEVAADLGQVDIVKYLIDCGFDINKSCGILEGGPIRSASFEGHIDVVKLLIDNGAVLDVSNAERNPLFAAIYNGHLDIVKLLVASGIDYKASYAIGGIDKCDAYEYARQYGRTEIAKYLKEIMGKPDVVKGPATDEKDSPYADGVEPVFPYDSFEKDLYEELCKCLKKHSDNKDICSVSISYWPELTTFIGAVLNTNSNLKSKSAKDSSEYMYYKYCEEEWEIGEEFKGLSKELVDYYNALKQSTLDDYELWEKIYGPHVNRIIEICKRALLNIKQSPEYALYTSLNLNVYVREFFSAEEAIAIFKELNIEQIVHEYERYLCPCVPVDEKIVEPESQESSKECTESAPATPEAITRFGAFEKNCDVSDELISKYEDIFPEQMLDVWKEYGFCSFKNGFFKIINPDDYKEQVKALFPESEHMIPIMITGLGDVVLWDKNGAVVLFKSDYGKARTIASDINAFLEGFDDAKFDSEQWDEKSYRMIARVRGKLTYDQCYYYDPLVRECGYRRAVHLKKKSITEYFGYLIQNSTGMGASGSKRMSRDLFMSRKKDLENRASQSIVIDEDCRDQVAYVYGIFYSAKTDEWIIYHTQDRGRTDFDMGCISEDIAFGMLAQEIEG